MMPEAPICLVLGCDEGFVMPLAVALFSALRPLGKDQAVVLYIIDGGIHTQSKMRLERVAQKAHSGLGIQWIAPSTGSMSGLEGARHLSPAAYLRLFIPELVPAEITRVLYLDCDLLVRGNLAELWNIDLIGKAMAATRDFAISCIGHPFSGVENYQHLGLNPEAAYFNSGILLIDTARWRTEKVAAKALSYALEHGAALGNCDQDALNATLSDDWQPLDYRWNVQYALFYLHDLPETDFAKELLPMRPALLKEAKIVHFTGTPKPWNHWCSHPATDEWVKTLLKSGWLTPRDSVKWKLGYGVKRMFFKIKTALRLYSQRERVS